MGCRALPLDIKRLAINRRQTTIVIVAVDKVSDILDIADDFSKVFVAKVEKYTAEWDVKCDLHREIIMAKAETLVSELYFHNSYFGFRMERYIYKQVCCPLKLLQST